MLDLQLGDIIFLIIFRMKIFKKMDLHSKKRKTITQEIARQDPFFHLPKDLVIKVFSFLDSFSIMQLDCVSSLWASCAKELDENFWEMQARTLSTSPPGTVKPFDWFRIRCGYTWKKFFRYLWSRKCEKCSLSNLWTTYYPLAGKFNCQSCPEVHTQINKGTAMSHYKVKEEDARAFGVECLVMGASKIFNPTDVAQVQLLKQKGFKGLD